MLSLTRKSGNALAKRHASVALRRICLRMVVPQQQPTASCHEKSHPGYMEVGESHFQQDKQRWLRPPEESGNRCSQRTWPLCDRLEAAHWSGRTLLEFYGNKPSVQYSNRFMIRDDVKQRKKQGEIRGLQQSSNCHSFLKSTGDSMMIRWFRPASMGRPSRNGQSECPHFPQTSSYRISPPCTRLLTTATTSTTTIKKKKKTALKQRSRSNLPKPDTLGSLAQDDEEGEEIEPSQESVKSSPSEKRQNHATHASDRMDTSSSDQAFDANNRHSPDRFLSRSISSPSLILPTTWNTTSSRAWRQWRKQPWHGRPTVSSPIDNDEDDDVDVNMWLSHHAQQLYDPKLHLSATAPTDWHDYQAITPLTDIIWALVGVTGRPMTVADYMRTALQHPEHGYYITSQRNQQYPATAATSTSNTVPGGQPQKQFSEDDWDRDEYDIRDDERNKTMGNDDRGCVDHLAQPLEAAKAPSMIGSAGDFVTSPEISQIFGEAIAMWFYSTCWQRIQTPDLTRYSRTWQWLECGPGNGSLIVDLLRCSLLQMQQADPGFSRSCRFVHLVETSPFLRQRQREALETFAREELASEVAQEIQFRFHESSFHDDRNKLDAEGSSLQPPIGDMVESSGLVDQKNTQSHALIIHIHWHDSLLAFEQWHGEELKRLNQGKQTYDEEVQDSEHDDKNMIDKSMLLTNRTLLTFCVAQEFLDALPVHVFEKTPQGCWRERLVDVALREDLIVDDENLQPSKPSIDRIVDPIDPRKPRLRLVLAPEATPAVTTLLGTDDQGFLLVQQDHTKDFVPQQSSNPLDAAPSGSVVEVCPEAILFVQDLVRILSIRSGEGGGGAALLIDYGQEGSKDSLRGYSKHEQVHFLSRPGQIDITADVDFAALKHAAAIQQWRQRQQQTSSQELDNSRPLIQAFGPITQGDFLVRMGIPERVIQLMESDHVSEEQAEDLYLALVRLASPEEMGERYKVLALAPFKPETPPVAF